MITLLQNKKKTLQAFDWLELLFYILSSYVYYSLKSLNRLKLWKWLAHTARVFALRLVCHYSVFLTMWRRPLLWGTISTSHFHAWLQSTYKKSTCWFLQQVESPFESPSLCALRVLMSSILSNIVCVWISIFLTESIPPLFYVCVYWMMSLDEQTCGARRSGCIPQHRLTSRATSLRVPCTQHVSTRRIHRRPSLGLLMASRLSTSGSGKLLKHSQGEDALLFAADTHVVVDVFMLLMPSLWVWFVQLRVYLLTTLCLRFHWLIDGHLGQEYI